MRYRLRTLLIVLAATVGIALAVAAIVVVREQGEMVRDAYCLDWASVAIVQHINDNEGRYPADWNDLKPAFVKATASDQSFSFEEVQARVIIDFRIDLSAPPDSTDRFVWVRSGRGVSWNSPEPNERILSRLKVRMR